MARILLIETSTALCSVALEIDGETVAARRSDRERAHASLTAVFCDEVLKEAGLDAVQLDAVCISDGPGSYTGLRVGLSTAKGLCFGAGLKLLSVSSLDVLAFQGAQMPEASYVHKIVPMLDARRMEVYTAVYDTAAVRETPIEARVVESGAYAGIAADTLFIGDGALKCEGVIGAGRFVRAFPEAAAMATLAEKAFAGAAWRDVAYFEPFYLKEFVPSKPKRNII